VRIAIDQRAFTAPSCGWSGGGLSPLNRRVCAHRDTDVVSAEGRALAREGADFVVRFSFVEERRGAFPIDRLCRVMNVSPRGLRAFRRRLASPSQGLDMVVQARFLFKCFRRNRCSNSLRGDRYAFVSLSIVCMGQPRERQHAANFAPNIAQGYLGRRGPFDKAREKSPSLALPKCAKQCLGGLFEHFTIVPPPSAVRG
jgi:hypothetical protein